MFAAGRSEAGNVAPEGKPEARDGRESDDDDWLRVGRSFKGAAAVPDTALVHERALQVYTKSKKRSRGESSRGASSGSDSDRALRRSRKHGKDHKKKKKKSSKRKKRDSKSRHRSRGDSDSDSLSRGSHDSEYRGSSKPRHCTEGGVSGQRHHHTDEVVQHRRTATQGDMNELASVDEPTHGELEVYSHKRVDHREMLFEFDCVGDRDNLVFGALYRHEQPLYHLATRRSVVDGSWIVERRHQIRQRAQQDAEDPKRLDTDRYFGGTAKVMEKRAGTRRLHLAYSQRRMARQGRGSGRGEKMQQVEEMSFIPLDAVVDGELDDVLTGQAQGDLILPNETHATNDSAKMLWRTDHENVERFIVERQKELNERVAAHPHDIEAWLDVIAFQDQTARLSGKKRGNDPSSDPSVREKQHAVWSKAIEKNPDSRRLRQLQLNLLWHEQQAKGDVSHSDSYRALVEQLLENDKTSALLWAKLIQCSQQKFGTFSMPVLRDLYARVVSVLNKELNEHMKNTPSSSASMASRNSSSFIHVMGANSLLGTADPYSTDSLDDKALRLSDSLVKFHQSMVRAELSAGYTERGVALVQALVEFNNIGRSQSGTSYVGEHPQQIEAFSKRWNEEPFHFGQEIPRQPAHATPQLPGVEVSDMFGSELIHQVLESMRTPEAIRSSAHDMDLLRPYVVEEDGSNVQTEEGSTAADGAKTENGGRWVYSNLHGQRIWIADSDESKEYERILDELRGSDASRERQRIQDKKLQSKNAIRADSLARLRDERTAYAQIVPDEDEFIGWLVQETRADLSQWEPLQPSNPQHSELLEMQPDRAILTEEILPFLFRAPRLGQLSSVLNLLAVMGLQLANSPEKLEDPTHLLSLDDLGEYSVLTAPILKALDPSASESISLSTRDRRQMVMTAIHQHVEVSVLATADRSRVQFIRNVFEAALGHFSNMFDDVCRLLKVVWMEYELAVLLRGEKQEETANAFRSFCQGLLASSGESVSVNVDSWLMSAYASLEIRLGNKRQMARICDKTVESLNLAAGARSSKLDRGFHRLIFLRVHQELSAIDGELGTLQAFYLLWRVWAPQSSDTLESITKHHRKNPAELEARLRTHLEEHQDAIVGKYRIELQIALDQCRSHKCSIQVCSSLLCNVAYALYNLCVAVYAVHGFLAARQEFDYFFKDAALTAGRCHDRQCWFMLFALMQTHHGSERAPSLPPREWRETVARGVKASPLEPLFLRLFVDAETSNTMSQSLRKYFQNRRLVWQRSLDSPDMVEWLFALLCEFARAERCGITYAGEHARNGATERATCCVLHHWGKNRPAVERIRRVFEEMASELKTSGVAVGWRLYLRFELAVGKVEAARKVFYRGLVKCPWSKAFYLDGFRVLRPYLSQDECQEISDFLAAKELHVRVDI